jgi:hypothetical protein
MLVSLFMALGITANAQLNWGVKAGLNVSTFSGLEDVFEGDSYSSYSEFYSNKAGFHIGINVQYMLTPQLGIESGLYYSMLGVKCKYSVKDNFHFNFEGEATLAPSYLQLPVSLLYKFNLGQDLSLYPSVGLYAGYGIGGKIKGEIEYISGSGDTDTEVNFFGKDNDDKERTNRFDLGLTLGLTLQYSKYTFGLGYDCGFLKVDKKREKDEIEDGYKYSFSKDGLSNRNFKVSVGYFF